MKLYKNVDICDLPSILKKGILSMDGCGNDNWMDGKRADNATDVVYLFKPLGKRNSFIQYGAVLLEVDVPNATINEMCENDSNKKLYEEYIVDFVNSQDIKTIYIPKICQNTIEIIEDERIEFVEFEADVYDSSISGYRKATNEDMNFLVVEHLISTSKPLYFRGLNEKKEVEDFYNIIYRI